MQRIYHPFEPIVFKDTEILILGTFPSVASFEQDFYYAHPRNAFWKILEAVTGYPVNNRDQKIWLLKENKLGLWDTVASCKRSDSLDTSLRDIVPNDIPSLLARYPSVRKLAFTGKKAQAIFEKHFKDLDIERVYLPSPSPAHAAMRFEEKVEAYRRLLMQ
jgi:hypoxanthine-DNA glycosylase